MGVEWTDPEGPSHSPGETVRFAAFVICMVSVFAIAIGLLRLWDSGSSAQAERRYYERKVHDLEFCEKFATEAVEWRECVDAKNEWP